MNNYALPPLPCRPTKWKPDLVNYPCIIQPKLNGIRCLLGPDGRAWSKTAKEFPGLIDYFKGHQYWLDGEIVDKLSIHNLDAPATSAEYLNRREVLTLQSINGIVSSHEPDPEDLAKLALVIFDLIIPKCHQYERLIRAEHLELEDNELFLRTKIAETWYDAKKHYDALPESSEGMIYRDYAAEYEHGNSTAVLKRKKFITKEYKCVSIHEGLGKFVGMFGGAVLELKDGRTFSCGGGVLTVKDRQHLWANPPIGKMITVKFPYYSDGGVPLQAQIESVRDYE